MLCSLRSWQKKQAKFCTLGDFLKRLALLLTLLTIIIFVCGCSRENGFKIPQKGIYTVSIEDSEIEFRATLDESFQEYIFTSPSTVCGMKATSYDGVNFTLELNGIKQEIFSNALQTVTDFSSAIELLRSCGQTKRNEIKANTDYVTASGKIKNGEIVKISFSDEKNTRIYKIKTEATG